MRRGDPIHPALVSRKRTYFLAALVVIIGVAGIAFGFSILSGRLPLMPAAVAGSAGKERPSSVEIRNTVSQRASEWGVKTCLGQIALVSDFLTINRSYTALAQRVERSVDARAFTSTIAARDPEGMESVSTFVSTPVGEGECNSSYQTVASFASSCETVHHDHFPGFDKPISFNDSVRAYTNGQESHLFLLPIDDIGCTAIKTQTVY
jgi:hypothetical protein